MAAAIEQLEPARVDEPEKAQQYADVLGQVAANHQPVIVQRGGEDLAAVISLEHFELLRELVAREEAERVAKSLDWDRIHPSSAPLDDWLEGDEPKPF